MDFILRKCSAAVRAIRLQPEFTGRWTNFVDINVGRENGFVPDNEYY